MGSKGYNLITIEGNTGNTDTDRNNNSDANDEDDDDPQVINRNNYQLLRGFKIMNLNHFLILLLLSII